MGAAFDDDSLLIDARWTAGGVGRFAREVVARRPGGRLLEGARNPPTLPGHLELTVACLPARVRHFFSPGFVPPLLRRPGLRMHLTIHDLMHAEPGYGFGSRHRLYYRRVVGPALRAARTIFTVSAWSRSRLEAWVGPDARIVPVGNGVAEAFVGVTRRESPRPTLLYVGNRKAHKNVSFMLECVARALGDGAGELLMTGSPDRELVRRIERSGLAGRVRFLGDPSDEQLARAYAGAWCLLLLSKAEGFGLPAAEAMAAGTPVLASDGGALPETVGKGGLVVKVDDSVETVATLRRILDQQELRDRLAEAGKREAPRFRWESVAQKVWDRVLGEMRRDVSY